MRRFQLVEIAEQPWCPAVVRDALTDYLQLAIRAGRAYAPAVPLLADALARAGTSEVVDLASGAGGPWPELAAQLAAAGRPVSVRLTDRFPNRDAFARVTRESDGAVTGDPRPIGAEAVPAELGGMRTMFSSFHHFAPPAARAILADAARRGAGIAVFEATRRDLRALLLTGLTPVLVLLVMPRLRPVRLARLLLTYLLPVIPLVVLFDGIVSCLRTYTVSELRAMTADLGTPGYEWRAGEAGDGPIPVTYLVGLVPAAAATGGPLANRVGKPYVPAEAHPIF